MNIFSHSQIRIYLLCCFVSLGGFMYGFDSGVMTTVLVMKKFQMKYGFFPYTLSTYTIVPSSLAASSIAALVSGFLADNLGRRKLLFISSVLHEIGCILQIGGNTQITFFIGRIMAGFSVGIYSMLIPLYQSEIAKPENRGRLITFYQIFVTLGFCVSFWLGYWMVRLENEMGYKIPIGLQLVSGFLLMIGVYFIPESPRWLIYQGHNLKALEILKRLRNNDVMMEYTGIIQDVIFDRNVKFHSFKSLFQKGNDNHRKRTLLGMGIHTFTQLTGINAILFYLPHILESAGITELNSTLLGNGCGGAVNFLATLFVLFYIDRWNRRTILIWGAIAMCGCMVAISIISAVFNQDLVNSIQVYGNTEILTVHIQNKYASYLILLMLCIFIAFFASSWGPIGWIYPAEIYPQMIRANAMGITTSCSYLINLLVSLISPIMFHRLTWRTYIFFSIMCLLMALIVHLYYPETRNRSLEEIQLVFSGALVGHRPEAHHPATAAEALHHLEHVQNNNKRNFYMDIPDLFNQQNFSVDTFKLPVLTHPLNVSPLKLYEQV